MDPIRLDQIHLYWFFQLVSSECTLFLEQNCKHKVIRKVWIIFEWNNAATVTLREHLPALLVYNKLASCSCRPPVADTLSQRGEMLILTPSVRVGPRLFISKIHSLHHSGWFTCSKTSCHQPSSLYFVCASCAPPSSLLPPPFQPENNITSRPASRLRASLLSFPDTTHRRIPLVTGPRRRNPEVSISAAPPLPRQQEGHGFGWGFCSALPHQAKTCALGWLAAARFPWVVYQSRCISAAINWQLVHRATPPSPPPRQPGWTLLTAAPWVQEGSSRWKGIDGWMDEKTDGKMDSWGARRQPLMAKR